MGNNNRVRWLRNFLLYGPYVAVLIPILICVVLSVQSVKQGRELSQAKEDIAALGQKQDELLQETESINAKLEELVLQLEAVSSATTSETNDGNGVGADVTSRDPDEWPTKVYLTFDDGPSPNTEKILEILDQYGVKGNFFVVGTRNESLLPYYQKIVDAGHVIGMHSYSHKYSEIYTSKEAFVEDLDKISSLIKEQTGEVPKIYRFPGGSSNSVSKVPMKDLIEVLDERGIRYFDWNVLSGDASNPILPAEEIVANSLDSISNYKEAMILFHDLSNKTTTVEALPMIIEALMEEGIPIAPIDDTTMLIQHNTNNN